jgi:hypothetical protein
LCRQKAPRWPGTHGCPHPKPCLGCGLSSRRSVTWASLILGFLSEFVWASRLVTAKSLQDFVVVDPSHDLPFAFSDVAEFDRGKRPPPVCATIGWVFKAHRASGAGQETKPDNQPVAVWVVFFSLWVFACLSVLARLFGIRSV